uniref:Uncharacterized protein n=2 Tax=Anguilla anguilla TaxID=7936 RepID=A0A0E9SM98_ANGAN
MSGTTMYFSFISRQYTTTILNTEFLSTTIVAQLIH